MPPVPPWLAKTWLIGGVVGAVGGLVASILAWVIVGSAATASGQSITLAGELLESVDGTIVSVDEALTAVANGLRTSQQSAADAAITLTQLSALASNLGDLVSEDVPSSLDAVRASLAPISATAGVLDTTLNALSFFGVDYDPAVPLDEAIADLDEQLADIPAELRRQGPLIGSAAESLNEFGSDTLVISQDLSDLRRQLIDTSSAISSYRTTVVAADQLLVDVESDLAGRLGLLKWVMVLIGMSLTVTQTVPITFGWWLLQADSDTAHDQTDSLDETT